MKIRKVICDRCKCEGKLKRRQSHFFVLSSYEEAEKGWTEVKGKDYCKKCSKLYKKRAEEMFQQFTK